jgi:uncharacterized tellurite resistance protein B-like protein
MFFNENINLTDDEKRVFLKAVVQIIVADGVIDKGESVIIKKIGAAYQMTKAMLNEAKADINRPLTDSELAVFDSEQKKLELIKALCTVATVDNELANNEVQLLIDITDRLGIEREKLLEINELVQDIFLLKTKNDLIMGLADPETKTNNAALL